jgi:hypothetical protein
MSSPRAIPRTRGPDEARGLSRLGILGAAGPGIRRSRWPGARRWSGPRRPRRQSDGPHVHGRPERRVVVSRAVPRRVLEPADVGLERRRPDPSGLLHRGRGAMRSTPEQADADRVRPLPAVLGAGGDAAREPSRRCRTRGRRDGGLPPHMARDGSCSRIAGAEVSPWRHMAAPTGHAPRIVSSEPAEHADRPSHPSDV